MRCIFSFFIFFSVLINPLIANAEDIVLAGGCFWCLEHDLESLPGINYVQSGYSGGYKINPNYENHVGHQEAVLVDFNPSLVDLEDILRLYFRNIDPLDGDGQFCDRGESYRPVIFYGNYLEENKSKDALIYAAKELQVAMEEIMVELKERSKFWLAEDYHQDFAVKNELKYKFYRFACGRDKRLDQLWGEKARSIKSWDE